MHCKSFQIRAMWVVNNEKERVKIYLRSDIESNITNFTHESNEIHNTIAAIYRAIGGTPSGGDSKLSDNCRRALQELSTALQNLNVCREYVERLDTREWIDDDRY